MAQHSSRAPDLDSQTLSRLAGGLAHELKNPLSTIGLHLDLLREQWVDASDPRSRRSVRSLDMLKQEIGRLNEILQDFLEFARTDQIEYADADLNELVQEVLRFVGPEAVAQDLRLEAFLDFELPSFPMDAARIRQALLNLVINARQSLEGRGGGSVTVITRKEGDEAVLEVVDDGPGMDSESLDRAFDVYYSSKKGGSGLGLPTVRRVVEAHGGSMTLESSPDHGTRARIRLPLAGSRGQEDDPPR